MNYSGIDEVVKSPAFEAGSGGSKPSPRATLGESANATGAEFSGGV